MNKKILIILAFSFLITLVSLISILGKFYKQNQSSEIIKGVQEKTLEILAPLELTSQKNTFKMLVEEYSRAPGKCKINITFVPKDIFMQEVCMKIDSNELPDIIISEDVITPILIKIGICEDITDFIKNENLEDKYSERLMMTSVQTKKYYGLPLTLEPFVLFYDQKILAKKNIDIPRDLDGLLKASLDVRGYSNYGFGFAAKQPEELSAFFYHMLYASGTNIYQINNMYGKKVFDILDTLKTKQVISPDTPNYNEADLVQSFIMGEISMIACNYDLRKEILKMPSHMEIGVEFMPYDKEVYLCTAKNISISTTANKEEAFDFLRFISSKDIVEKIAEEMNTLPARQDIEYKLQDGPCALSVDYAARFREKYMLRNSFTSWLNISYAIYDNINLILMENKKPKDAANQMQDKVRVAILEQ